MWECIRVQGWCGKIRGECAGMCVRETRQSLWRVHQWQGGKAIFGESHKRGMTWVSEMMWQN